MMFKQQSPDWIDHAVLPISLRTVSWAVSHSQCFAWKTIAKASELNQPAVTSCM